MATEKIKVSATSHLATLGLLFVFLYLIPNPSIASELEPHPRIWVKKSDKADILIKIKSQDWAKSLYSQLQSRVDFVFTSNDRRRFLRELPLITSTDNKIFPTLPFFRVKGGGSTKQSKKLIKSVVDAVDCGVLFYLTDNETYAQCATDILHTILNVLKRMPIDRSLPKEEFRNKGWIYPTDHLYEARAIGAQLPIIYDFIHPYISTGGLAYNLHTNQLEPFDFELAQQVFKTYVWLALNNGPTTSNWPIYESPSLVHNILALDNQEDVEQYLPLYTHIDTYRHTSLKTVANHFKDNGNVWPESFQYSKNVANFSIYLMTLLDRYDKSLALGGKYSNILSAFRTYYDIKYPNGEYPFLGDGHRWYPIYYQTHEMSLLLSIMNDNNEEENFYRAYLASSLKDGVYKREELKDRYYGARPYLTPLQLLWQLDKVESKTMIDLHRERPRASELPFAGVHIQRNTSFEQPEKNSLMAFVGGSSYIHGHASGMDMELYGQGVVLGIDGGKGRYNSEIHENYYRLFAAHNTVISNGASASSKGWLEVGINPVQHKYAEPKVNEDAVSPNYSFSTSSFTDKFNLVSQAEHQRTLALIKVSSTQGYYLDIFRAKSDYSKQYHDYIYHNLGDKLTITSNGNTVDLMSQPTRYQAATDGKWVYHKKYNHPGWTFFKDVQSSSKTQNELEMTFTASKISNIPILMRALSPAGSAREVTKVIAPPSKAAATPYDKKPLPTFLLRKQGEAWNNPFVVLYESTIEGAPFTIQSTERLFVNNKFIGVKVEIDSESQQLTQYILIQEGPEDIYQNKVDDIYFMGQFGVVSINRKTNSGDLYIGKGSQISYKKVSLSVSQGSAGYKVF